MANRPITYEVSLTGGAVYDLAPIPKNVRRIEVKSKEGNNLNMRYDTTSDPWTIPVSYIDDTGWLPNVYTDAKVYINGEGNALIRVWV